MNKRQIAFLSILSLSLSLPLIPAHSATKAGAKCTKVGSKSVAGNKTFTCIKSGKKLVWNKGVAVKTPTLTPTPTPRSLLTLASPLSNFLPWDSCKIQSTGSKFNTVGFPLNSIWGGARTGNFINPNNEVKALIIPVDFPKYRATTNPKNDFASLVANTNSYFKAVSYQNLSFNFTIWNRYFTMSSNPEDFSASAWQSNMLPYFLEGLRIASGDITLKDFDVVYVISLQSISTSLITPGPAFFGPYQTSSGVVNLGSAAGSLGSERNQWRWLVHETGHLLGLVELYGWVGSYLDDDDRHRYFGDWDIMSQNWKDSPIELNGWFRYQLGWLNESGVRCLDSTSFLKESNLSIAVTAIELKDENPKIGVIRLGNQKALVFEYRKNLGFDVLKKSEEGVLVYLVDGEKDSRTGPLQIQPRLGSTSKLLYDAALRIGDKISIEGYEINFLNDSEYVALIEVRKK